MAAIASIWRRESVERGVPSCVACDGIMAHLLIRQLYLPSAVEE
jgi:hypothetical protein